MFICILSPLCVHISERLHLCVGVCVCLLFVCVCVCASVGAGARIKEALG